MSATEGGPFTTAEPELLDGLGSVWSPAVFVAVFTIVPGCVTVATIASEADAPFATLPTAQTPVAAV